MNTIEKNKLIAKFMGYIYYPYDFNLKKKDNYNFFGWMKDKEHLLPMSIKLDKFGLNYLCRRHKDLKFDSDWNWLIEVIKKTKHIISKKKELNNDEIYIYQNIKYSLLSLEIQKIWESVVKFIEYYNSFLLKKNDR